VSELLQQVISRIEQRNPMHAKKLRKTLQQYDEAYYTRVDGFLKKYNALLDRDGKDLDYGIDCYLRMCSDMMYEQIRFLETGRYSSTSFEEVNKRVYNNPQVMEYYMHGLILSDFLWLHHYRIHEFFVGNLPQYAPSIKRYLEIGGGIGLTIVESLQVLDPGVHFDVVDISPSSIEISKSFVANSRVNYFLADIFDFSPKDGYDFITMGEVLEHVEDPLALLKRLNALLNKGGHAFITVPANAPTIDHIYLFRNAQDIRDVIGEAGLGIEKEISIYAEDVSQAKAEERKVALLYGAFLKKID